MTGDGPVQASPESAGTAWASVPAMFATTVDRHGDALAVVDGADRLTWAELGGLVDEFAAAVVASGVEPGDRVAIWAPNSARWIVAVLGLLEAGAVLVPVNTRFKGTEAADILERSGTRLLVTTTDFLGTDYVAMLEETGRELPSLDAIVVADGPVPDRARSWDGFVSYATPDARAEVATRATRSIATCSPTCCSHRAPRECPRAC